MKLKELISKDKKGKDIVLDLRLRKKTQSNPDKEVVPDVEDGGNPDMSGQVPDQSGTPMDM